MGITRRKLLGHAARLTGAATAAQLLPGSLLHAESANDPVLWISTTETAPWQTREVKPLGFEWDTLDVEVDLSHPAQTMQGFGACFNELGWNSLQALPADDRTAIFRELFAPGVGAAFTLCRAPIGANDFARKWYSYDESPGDFALEHFSIANDLETLVPFIHSAQHFHPKLRVWSSPWSPPAWMKRNGSYAEAMPFPGWPANGLKPSQVGHEGETMFLLEDRYLDAYARYFGKYIDAYRAQGIDIDMVMPQNEFNSAQSFPSCTWTADGLAQFIAHLGPVMAERHVEVFFGTLERGNIHLLDTTMNDPRAAKYIKGVGVQWAGKAALPAIHAQYPQLAIYGSEQECGDGKNTWEYCGYCWDLMKDYLRNGASGYMYWNLSLKTGGLSHWGWAQNSLITVDAQARTYRYNHEYYLLKHVSHFVTPGAQRVATRGTFDDVLAFTLPDKSVVVVAHNASPFPRPLTFTAGARKVSISMDGQSFHTLRLPSSQS
jgi:glucosylceramidase